MRFTCWSLRGSGTDIGRDRMILISGLGCSLVLGWAVGECGNPSQDDSEKRASNVDLYRLWKVLYELTKGSRHFVSSPSMKVR